MKAKALRTTAIPEPTIQIIGPDGRQAIMLVDGRTLISWVGVQEFAAEPIEDENDGARKAAICFCRMLLDVHAGRYSLIGTSGTA